MTRWLHPRPFAAPKRPLASLAGPRCARRTVRVCCAQENVLLDAGDNCKVCDFGLAHVYEVTNKQMQTTMLREICGSKSYCAPEVLEGRGYNGFPTDVWSCGICLFAMLAGFFPLDEASGSDWRFERIKMATQQGCSVTHTIFGFYDRPCTLSDEVTDLIDGMMILKPDSRLLVKDVLESPWLLAEGSKKGMDVDGYRPVYRGVSSGSGGEGITAEALAAMWANDENAQQRRPAYRSMEPAPEPPPMLAKQDPMLCEDFFHL